MKIVSTTTSAHQSKLKAGEFVNTGNDGNYIFGLVLHNDIDEAKIGIIASDVELFKAGSIETFGERWYFHSFGIDCALVFEPTYQDTVENDKLMDQPLVAIVGRDERRYLSFQSKMPTSIRLFDLEKHEFGSVEKLMIAVPKWSIWQSIEDYESGHKTPIYRHNPLPD